MLSEEPLFQFNSYHITDTLKKMTGTTSVEEIKFPLSMHI